MNLLNFVLALGPIIWLIIALMGLKQPAWKASVQAALLAAIEALLLWKTSWHCVMFSAIEGICMALWPIVLVIVAAVFTYNLVCASGAMDLIKQMLLSLSSDKRVLVLLIAWCFGGFMEGMAGFGTAIAIPAGMLAAVGFPPLFSCMICLLCNSFPTPWGSIGIPTTTLASLVGFSSTNMLSWMQTIQVAVFMCVIPLIVVALTGKGLKALKGVWWLALASGAVYVAVMLAVSAFLGAELCMIIASICSLALTACLARYVKEDEAYTMKVEKKPFTAKQALCAVSPFVLICLFLLSTSKLVPPVNEFLSRFSSTVYFVSDTSATTFQWINTPGVWIFLAAVIGARIQHVSVPVFKKTFLATLKQMSGSIGVMLSVLAAAKIMIYSGMIREIANFAIAAAGAAYPLIAPWLGALGTFVTGSGTSSSVLFGQVQLDAAQALSLNPYWVVGLNSLGVGVGKMLSPQSIAIALSAVGGLKEDSKLLKMMLPYGAVFLVCVSVIGIAGSMVFGG